MSMRSAVQVSGSTSKPVPSPAKVVVDLTTPILSSSQEWECEEKVESYRHATPRRPIPSSTRPSPSLSSVHSSNGTDRARSSSSSTSSPTSHSPSTLSSSSSSPPPPAGECDGSTPDWQEETVYLAAVKVLEMQQQAALEQSRRSRQWWMDWAGYMCRVVGRCVWWLLV